MPDVAQMHESTAWSTQHHYGGSKPALTPAELSTSWATAASKTSDYHLPSDHLQTHPSVHGGFPYPGMHHRGAYTHANGWDAPSAGVASSSAQHSSKGMKALSYTPPSATSGTLPASNHQVTMAAAAATNGDLIATGSADVTAPLEFGASHMASHMASHVSITKSGREGPKRGLPGRTFEPNLAKVQRRLRWEGAHAGAVEYLSSEIFRDGMITKEALKAKMTRDQQKVRDGTQKYMLLLHVVRRRQGGPKERDHRCLLCPPWARVVFKLREDSLRHFHKDHFGLSFDCGDW